MKLILPKEHGSWSLALEPVALGALAAFSVPGAGLAIAAVGGFFLRRPLKLLLRDPADERRPAAIGTVLVLTLLAASGLLFAAMTGGVANLWPLLPAAMAGMAFAWFDLRNEGREGAAELTGACAFGIVPAAFATLAGWNVPNAIALGAIMLVRSVPTVLFVRTYLRIKKGRPVTRMPAMVAATVGVVLTAWLISAKMVPWPAAVFAMVMAIRTIWLLDTPPRLTARTMGVAEAVFGVVMVVTLALTWKLA